MSSEIRPLDRSTDQVTNRISSSPAPKRARHQVSLPSSSTALAPPSSPSRPGSSILIDRSSEDSLAEENYPHRRTGKESTNRRQRMSFAQHLETTAD
jgi:hypothetical protein